MSEFKKKGRKSLDTYLDSRKADIIKWTSEGFVDIEIISMLKVASSTYYKWLAKATNKDFQKEIGIAKHTVDSEILAATMKAAKGYEYVEETIEYEQGEDGRTTIVGIKRHKKHQPANAMLNKFWLINRRSADFKDKVVTEHQGRITTIADIIMKANEDLPVDEE